MGGSGVLLTVLFLCWGICSTAFADQLILKNGQVVECNILKEDADRARVKVDVVIDGQLAGIQMAFGDEEIQEIKRDGRYQGVVRPAPSVVDNGQAVQPAVPQPRRYGPATPLTLDEKIKMRTDNEIRRQALLDEQAQKERLQAEARQHQKELAEEKARRESEELRAAQNRSALPRVVGSVSKHGAQSY
jgi:hypothetical protein